jgi:peroxiredoxin
MQPAIPVLITAAAIALLAVIVWVRTRGLRPVPAQLEAGSLQPDFEAIAEQGRTVRSGELRGAPAVILFVRGNWCPFCKAQVRELTKHYRDITDNGARLILVTPKPLETTRRVADFFDVNFEFWLDDSLNVTRDLGLLLENGVPGEYRQEYGPDTTWPAALVVDTDGVIRYTQLSRHISDRPKPEMLLAELRKVLRT